MVHRHRWLVLIALGLGVGLSLAVGAGAVQTGAFFVPPDDDQRSMVMINFNQDLDDAWEWADLPQYPERYTSQAYRLGVNYIVYSLSH
jgi:uncharacterized protein DUF4159